VPRADCGGAARRGDGDDGGDGDGDDEGEDGCGFGGGCDFDEGGGGASWAGSDAVDTPSGYIIQSNE